jgi:taurine--2-oxoglutarate transaminase
VCCAASLAAIDAYEEEGLIENASKLGEVFAEKLGAMKEKHPLIGDVRCIGLFGAIEMVKDKQTREPLSPWNGPAGPMAEVAKRFDDQGVAAFLRWNYIFLAPPLIITEAELLDALSTIDRCLTEAEAVILG